MSPKQLTKKRTPQKTLKPRTAAASRTRPAVRSSRPGPGKARVRDWRDLTAGEVMQSNVVTVDANAPLSEVERLLSEHRIGGLPVTNEAGHVLGVISVRDLIERYTEDTDARPRRTHGFYDVATYELEEEDLESFEVPEESEETAGEVMTAQVVAVDHDDPLRKVARIMVGHNVHRVLVKAGEKTVGLLSTMDMLRAAAR